jgi:hypothetical protein
VLLLTLFVGAVPAAAGETLRVYYAGPTGPVRQALELAAFDLVDDPAQADLLVLNDTMPDAGVLAAQVRAFWAATALGARLSPLHGRFPITIGEEALAEARKLTEERVRL